eukprot:360265-Chlamydomonas_euryale.AAC.7
MPCAVTSGARGKFVVGTPSVPEVPPCNTGVKDVRLWRSVLPTIDGPKVVGGDTPCVGWALLQMYALYEELSKAE